MAIKYDKIEQGLYVAIGDGLPSGTPALGSPYTDNVTGCKYVYTTSGWKSLLNPRVQSVVSNATITGTSETDLVDVTALAVGTTLVNPTGTFVNGQIVSYRIKDNATPQTIAYGAKFKAFGSALPTTTVASKITLLSAMYNSVSDTFETVNSQEQ